MSLSGTRRILLYTQRQRHVQRRLAHAARLPEEGEAGPSNWSQPRQHGTSDEQDYKFPEKGRAGGAPDPFEVLGLDRSASEKDIKQRYYKLAMILHPDSSHPSSSQDHFAMLHRAYTLLSQSQSRLSYLQTGYGWSPKGETNRYSEFDAHMRAEVNARRRGGAAAWETGKQGFRPENRYQWAGYSEFSQTPEGTGEPRYMSNRRFMALFTSVSLMIGWVQYHRVGMAADTHRELLREQHVGASQALAEAREDAIRFGKERRERIRRRVREIEVLNEVDKQKESHDDDT